MDKRKNATKKAILAYLKSRRNAFLRMAVFSLLAALIYGIGKAWKESFYITLYFLYPISLGAALFQFIYFLPRSVFLKPKFQKLLKWAKENVLAVMEKLGDAVRRLGNALRPYLGRSHKDGEKLRGKTVKRGNRAYQDEFLYAKGSGLFGQKRYHLRWRDMETNQDKVRFFYMRYVVKMVKKGKPFSYHFTPVELKGLWKNPEGAEPLTGLYYRARYGGKAISEEEILGLSREGQEG